MKVTEVFWGSRAWIGLLILSLLAFIFVEMITGSVSSKPQLRPGDPLNAFLSHMNDRVPALIEQYQIPGCSIALLQNNKIVWLQAYGYADLDSGRILTWDTPMRVQSISKPVSAWGVMKLVEQGMIDLDAPVSQYLKSWSLPEMDYPSEAITVRRLLSHTAGLPWEMYLPFILLERKCLPSRKTYPGSCTNDGTWYGIFLFQHRL